MTLFRATLAVAVVEQLLLVAVTELQKKADAILVLMEPVFFNTKTESVLQLHNLKTVAILRMRPLTHKSVALDRNVLIVVALSTRRLTQKSVVQLLLPLLLVAVVVELAVPVAVCFP
jgi:hypothetical protein